MTMPAGVYYIGDLCYVLNDEWDEFCNITIQDDVCIDGEFTLSDGRKFATYGTMYGDGEYHDQYNNRYFVDAGLIGCIKLEDIRIKTGEIHKLGAIFGFKNDFETSSIHGTISFGHVKIDTNPMAKYGENDE